MSKGARLGVGLLGLLFNVVFTGPGAFRLAWEGNVGDFLPFYVAFRLTPTHEQYDLERVFHEQERVIGERRPKLLPVRLPFYYAAFSMLGKLPYQTAYRSWLALMFAATLAALLVYPVADRTNLFAAALASLPLLRSVLVGQDVGILLLIMALGLRFRSRGMLFVSGLIFSLFAIKMHLFALIPVLFLLRREFRAVAGMLLGSSILAVASFVTAGRDWPSRYWRIVSDPATSPGAQVMPNLHGMADFLGQSAAMEMLLALVVIGLVLWIAVGWNFEIAFSAAAIGGFLIGRHAYVHDAAILIPALLWCLPNPFAFLSLTPIPYFLAIYLDLGIIPVAILTLVLCGIVRANPPAKAWIQRTG